MYVHVSSLDRLHEFVCFQWTLQPHVKFVNLPLLLLSKWSVFMFSIIHIIRPHSKFVRWEFVVEGRQWIKLFSSRSRSIKLKPATASIFTDWHWHNKIWIPNFSSPRWSFIWNCDIGIGNLNAYTISSHIPITWRVIECMSRWKTNNKQCLSNSRKTTLKWPREESEEKQKNYLRWIGDKGGHEISISARIITIWCCCDCYDNFDLLFKYHETSHKIVATSISFRFACSLFLVISRFSLNAWRFQSVKFSYRIVRCHSAVSHRIESHLSLSKLSTFSSHQITFRMK